MISPLSLVLFTLEGKRRVTTGFKADCNEKYGLQYQANLSLDPGSTTYNVCGLNLTMSSAATYCGDRMR